MIILMKLKYFINKEELEALDFNYRVLADINVI
jgi:hypothetical protein